LRLQVAITFLTIQTNFQADDSCDRTHNHIQGTSFSHKIVGWALPETLMWKGFTKWWASPTLLSNLHKNLEEIKHWNSLHFEINHFRRGNDMGTCKLRY